MGEKKEFFDGSVRSRFGYPSLQNVCDPKPEEGWRRKSGTTETLTSHAGEDYFDIVQSTDILLHFVIFRAAWLDRRPRFSSERAADVSIVQTQSTNGGSQGVRMLTKCS